MAGPLIGLKVLDMSRVLAGPWAGQVFADLGADVIKIERPVAGDDTRHWGPPNHSSGESAYYLSTNRGKKSLAVDITTVEGQAIIKRLVAESDILLENYKVGGLKKYGLDYDALKAVKPDLIYCSITGFGQDGPYADEAGYDLMIQAMGGFMGITGKPDGTPGGGPQKLGVAISDLSTGLYSVIAILAALRHRDAMGEGQHIDMSLLDVTVGLLANQNMNYLISGENPKRMGNAHMNIVPYQDFPTKDGHIIVAAGNDRQFQAFLGLAGDKGAALASDARYTSNADRVKNRDSLIPKLEEILRERTTAEWIEALNGAKVPCGPINTIDDIVADPQVQHRGMYFNLPHARGTVLQVKTPISYSKTKLSYDKAPPMLGEDTVKVLKQLGYNDDEINTMLAAGIIGGNADV